MMRIGTAALAAAVALPALVSLSVLPAHAQVTYAPEAYSRAQPPIVTVRRGPYRAVEETVLVPHTRYVRRTVLVPRTHYVRRRVTVPVTTYRPVTGIPADVAATGVATYPVGAYAAAPVAAPAYPDATWIGPTWVPPGTRYGCRLGTVGCDSSVVGEVGW